MTDKSSVSITIAAQNTYSNPLTVDKGDSVAVSITANGDANTINVERSLDGGTTWGIMADNAGETDFTENTELDIEVNVSCIVRIGCPTGGYITGSPVCLLVTER